MVSAFTIRRRPIAIACSLLAGTAMALPLLLPAAAEAHSHKNHHRHSKGKKNRVVRVVREVPVSRAVARPFARPVAVSRPVRYLQPTQVVMQRQLQPAPVIVPSYPTAQMLSPVQQRVQYDVPYSSQPITQVAAPYAPAERWGRCNTGRLVGGLVGGGLGYGIANGRDRIWATPLGALVGSEVGCVLVP